MNEFVPIYAGLKAVLFDMDGVLTHNAQFHKQAWRECAGQEYGVLIEEGSLVIHAGHTWEILQKLLGGPVSREEVRRFHDLKEHRYRELARGNLTPVPGLHRYLEWLKEQNLKLALVTGSDQINARFVLESLGVEEVFDLKVTAEHFQAGKPSPECYVLALNKLGLTPGQVLVHEDSPGGVQAATGAGCRVMALETTTSARNLLQHGARWTIPDFETLLSSLQATPVQAH
ncbi:HAD family hydrolase [Deinococcus cellulosilyticus]|uniref:Hydrolase n=1 Tax=Deinococcus cellulosilyticus (strain DSM 18568 / NBRC 106333 / KACC 11606 / 5516J-15) TaxID=1223518 RepID=A0A511MZG2_DEIC1|nr:HAD family phosphatase [Deinococcus cellulosilyticus]GEM45567.1 hydrolase [Deinococcus cellulosilyticus NBRC 106333 = KACC 11606]